MYIETEAEMEIPNQGECRQARWLALVDDFKSDLLFALRSIRKTALLSVVVVVVRIMMQHPA